MYVIGIKRVRKHGKPLNNPTWEYLCYDTRVELEFFSDEYERAEYYRIEFADVQSAKKHWDDKRDEAMISMDLADYDISTLYIREITFNNIEPLIGELNFISSDESDYWNISSDDESKLTDMLYAVIYVIMKHDESESFSSRYEVGADFTKIPYANAYTICNILVKRLGYKIDNEYSNTMGWHRDREYYDYYSHPDVTKFPPLIVGGIGVINTCSVRGLENDKNIYTDENGYVKIELDNKINSHIISGLNLLSALKINK